MTHKIIKRFVGPGLFLLAGLTFLSSPLEAQVNRGGGVPRETLSVSLRGLDIKDYFVASSSPKAGVIQALTGHVVIIHGGTGVAFFGREGDIVYENDAINTLENSRCKIKFSNDDVVKLAPDTNFGVETYIDDRKGESKTSIFTIFKGKAKFYALRLLRYRKSKFEVKTPTAVVGVRGTKFGVHVYWEDEPRLSKGGIQVADSSKKIGDYLALLGPSDGQKSYTDSHCDVGEIDQNGVIIPAGFGYQEKTGDLGPMDPVDREAFDADTSAVEQEQELKEEQQENPNSPESIEEGAKDKATLAYQMSNQTDTTVDQNHPLLSLPASPSPTPPADGNNMGYFAALMNRSSTTSLHDVYVTSTRQDFDSTSIKGRSILNSGGYLESNPDGFGTPGDPSVTRIVTDGGTTDSGASLNSQIMTPLEGSSSYIKWGRWNMNNAVSIGPHTYTVDDLARYLFGQVTPNDNIAGFSGSAQYMGNAHGHYVGNVYMGGNFSCDVNFDTGQVSDFDMNIVSGDTTHAARIFDAFGSLNGSEFSLSGGSWELYKGGNTKVPTHKSLQGSLFGPNAEEMGGVWGMYFNDSHAATGLFEGDKQ